MGPKPPKSGVFGVGPKSHILRGSLRGTKIFTKFSKFCVSAHFGGPKIAKFFSSIFGRFLGPDAQKKNFQKRPKRTPIGGPKRDEKYEKKRKKYKMDGI